MDRTQAHLVRMVEQFDRDARVTHPDDDRAAQRAADLLIAAYVRGLTRRTREVRSAA